MGRSLLERLAALEHSVRRQGPDASASASAGAPTAEAMEAGQRPHEIQVGWRGDEAGDRPDAFASSRPSLERLGFRLEDDGFGPVWHRELRYDVLAWYGTGPFLDLLECDLETLLRLAVADEATGEAESVASSTALPGIQPSAPQLWAALRFYDTETTGLGSGAGTFPFLHAVGQVEGDEWVVHQYLLADYTEEAALLQTLACRHFQPGAVIVTYNGRSFDWPLLESRFTLYRLSMPRRLRQLDLVHPCRRLWRRRLGRTNLTSVEEGILGVHRTADLPGKEAPGRYFQFLADADPLPLVPVCDHNAADVSSLARLAAVVSDVLAGRRPVETGGEYTALARWYGEWGEYDLAERCLVAAAECPDSDWQARWLRGLLLKRQQRWPEAGAVWREMTERFLWTVAPLVELAKLAEHREKDLAAAAAWTRQALQRLDSQEPVGRTEAGGIRTEAELRAWQNAQLSVAGAVPEHQRDRVRAQLLHRMRRLNHKLGQA
ncbi:ribonuclease H-like domain-containing protein [Alicyclobacillus shizuokensis]|uniref:ribonuclease H-like domain-containing protein n=1 Tax=Alicyclobacillus shizuokensis TaxID=392014 RepID=UPI000A6D89BC|nr:ribonuclease H-like domain-containing protein [Alicyclobacillus shizuokensis]MCL6627066.1 ribonuclease H-like domain-containing protein [Alicyclobacillus shizuokensis]